VRSGALSALLVVLFAGACGPDVVQAGNDDPADSRLTDLTFVPASSTTTVASAGSSTTTIAPSLIYKVGDCLDFDQADAASLVEVVPCTAGHLVEVSGPLLLESRYPRAAPFPSATEVNLMATTDCDTSARAYLRRDVATGESPGVLLPAPEAWARGDRGGWCTIGLTRVSGKRPSYTGSLRDR